MRVFIENYELKTDEDYIKVAKRMGDEFMIEIQKHKEELEKSVAVRSMYFKDGYLIKIYKEDLLKW